MEFLLSVFITFSIIGCQQAIVHGYSLTNATDSGEFEYGFYLQDPLVEKKIRMLSND